MAYSKLQRDIEQIKNLNSGNVTNEVRNILQDEVERVKKFHGYIPNKPQILDRLELYLQTLALFGVGAVVDLIGTVATESGAISQKIKYDYNTIENTTKGDRLQRGQIRPTLTDSAIESKIENDRYTIQSKHTASVENSVDIGSGLPVAFDAHEQILSFLSSNGLNYLNKWYISFGNNKQLSASEIAFLNSSVCEVEITGLDLSIGQLPLGFSFNRDVNDVTPSDISITFYQDEKMKIQNILKKILYKIYNNITGRYGYKNDYKFEDIKIIIDSSKNVAIRSYTFGDCVISSDDSLSLSYNDSELKLVKQNFVYDFML